MPKSGGLPLTARAADCGDLQLSARAVVSRTCHQAAAGKLAVRQLAAWARPFGLGEAEFRLLWQLMQRGGGDERENSATDQAELAERLAVSAAQVSSVVERLRSRKLIESVRDSGDRRRQCWRLTTAGVRLVEAVVTSVAASGIPPLAPWRPGASATFEGGGSEAEAAA